MTDLENLKQLVEKKYNEKNHKETYKYARTYQYTP